MVVVDVVVVGVVDVDVVGEVNGGVVRGKDGGSPSHSSFAKEGRMVKSAWSKRCTARDHSTAMVKKKEML